MYLQLGIKSLCFKSVFMSIYEFMSRMRHKYMDSLCQKIEKIKKTQFVWDMTLEDHL